MDVSKTVPKCIQSVILAVLLSVTFTCSGQGNSSSFFAPLANVLGFSSASYAFSNELTDPTRLPPDVTVTQPHQAGSGSVPIRGIIAMDSARLGSSSRVDADVSVLGTEGSRDLVLQSHARIEVDRTARADRIKLKKRASIRGTAEYNTISLGKKASVSNQVSPLGALPLLPPFLKGTPGSRKIGHADSPLPAGNYGRLELKKKRTLVLAGGFYHFRDVHLGQRSSLVCASTCVVLIKERMLADDRVSLSSLSGKTNDLIFFVEGAAHYHHGCEHPHHSNVRLGKRTSVIADIYAPAGKLRLGRRSTYRGNIIARKVVVGHRAQVETGAEVLPQVAKVVNAGVASVLEIPGAIRLDIPACALSQDQVISIQMRAKTSGTPVGAQSFRAFGTVYELQPTGLTFNCPVAMAITYDPSDLAVTGLPAENVRILTSSDGSDYAALPGQPDPGAHQAHAQVSHFSLFITGTFGAESTTGVVVRGDYAYTASQSVGGLLILNVSNKANPVEAGRAVGSGGSPGSIAISGNQAFIANVLGTLDVFDISNPLAPVFQGTYDPGVPPGLLALQFSVSDGHLFLPVHGGGVHVLRLGTSIPTFLQSVPNTPANSAVLANGNFVYACDASGLPILKTLGGSTGHNAVIGQVNRSGFPCAGMAAANGHLFIVSNLTGAGSVFSNLEIMSITTPDSPIAPRSVATFDPPHPDTYFTGIKVRGRYAFVTYAGFDTGTNMLRDQGGMLTLDISNPAAPVQLRDDQFPTAQAVSAAAHALDIDGDYAFASANGLQILGISAFAPDPAPTNLTVQPGAGQVFLDWDDVPGAVLYRVYRGETAGFDPDTARFFDTPISQLYNSTGDEGQPRYYVVRAIMPGGIESAGTPEIGAMSSLDWNQRGAGINTILHSITFGNGIYAAAGESSAVGAQNGMYSSTTANAWTQAAIGGHRGTAFGAGNFLALSVVGGNSRARTSVDAAAWSGFTAIAGQQLRAAAYGAGRFVAVGFSGAIAYSADGQTWTPAVSGTPCHLASIAWSGTEFVAISDVGGCGIALRSTDGINWTTITLPRAVVYRRITYGGFLFVAVGFNGTIITSTDGITWEDRSLTSNLTLTAVAYGSGYYVVLGGGQFAFASRDGRNWVHSTAPGPYPNSCINDLVFANSQFVAVGENCQGSGEAVIATHPPWNTGVP